MIEVFCMVKECGALTKAGALLFSDPYKDKVLKFHLCCKHYDKTIAFLSTIKVKKRKVQQDTKQPLLG